MFVQLHGTESPVHLAPKQILVGSRENGQVTIISEIHNLTKIQILCIKITQCS